MQGPHGSGEVLRGLVIGHLLKVRVDLDPFSCFSKSLLGKRSGIRGTPDILLGYQEIHVHLLFPLQGWSVSWRWLYCLPPSLGGP